MPRSRFQSPSRWGRCCIKVDCTSQIGTVAFQSPSRWGRCCIQAARPMILGPQEFQSPSRWGRCCIGVLSLDPGTALPVSVPFSMGTVLHRMRWRLSLGPSGCFSPLLDGDGVASPSGATVPITRAQLFQSPSRWGRCCIDRATLQPFAVLHVSVPFSMGTVLHLSGCFYFLFLFHCFSPLLDGDGVAS